MNTLNGQSATGNSYTRPYTQPYPNTTTPYYWPTTTYVTQGSEADRLRFALELIEDLDDVDQIRKIVAKALKTKKP